MKFFWTFFIFVFLLLINSHAVHALQETRPLPTDPRIRTFVYDPNEVFKFIGHYKYQSSIELSPDESISTVSLGDSVAWQVAPSGNRIFIKPIEADAITNMTVVTNKRIYHFELHAEEAEGIEDEELIFSVRFQYPNEGGNTGSIRRFQLDEEPDIEKNRELYNFNYTISGDDFAAPLRIFDDGEFTYFEFRDKNAEIPAFFLVDPDGSESILNYRVAGKYIVVEQVASQFTLRNGPAVVCAFNERSPLGKPDPEPERKFLGIF